MSKKQKKRSKGSATTTMSLDDAVNLYAKAAGYFQNGKLSLAEKMCRKILAVRPTFADALHLTGVIATNTGRHQEAFQLISKAVEKRKDSPFFFNSLGNACLHLGRLEEAKSAYEQSIALDPNFFHGLNNLGCLCQQTGQLQRSVELFQKALSIHPNFADGLCNLGRSLTDLGQAQEALPIFENALQLQPDNPAVHNNQGLALKKIGRYEEAETAFQKALQLAPNLAEAANNMGVLCKETHRFGEAGDWYEKALQMNPQLAGAHANQGDARNDEGDWREALACYARAMALQPGDGLKIRAATVLPVIPQDTAEIEAGRSRFMKEMTALLDRPMTINDPFTDVARPMFFVPYSGRNDVDLMTTASRVMRTACPALKPGPPLPARSNGGRIRVAFISKYFKNHTMGKLYKGLITGLPREDFEVVVFTFAHPSDETTRHFEDNADEVIVLPIGLEAAVARIRERAPDILFYTDIGMDCLTWLLAFKRLAPIQCATFGQPTTSGLDTIDFQISCRDLEVEGAEDSYTESLIRLENLPIYYHVPELKQARDRSYWDLPQDANLYICPQSLFKFHPDYDQILADILDGDPKGLLLLLEGSYPNWTRMLRERMQQNIPACQRIRFLPRMSEQDFLALLNVCDVMLDPTHFGGGNTTYEGLAVATPIVTWPSQFMRGRVTLAVYRQMGYTELVADDASSYVDLAHRLGTDPVFNAQARQHIRDRRDVIYENQAAINDLAACLKQLWSEAAGQD